MFFYDNTNEAISNDACDDKYGVYRCYGNARWLKHDGMSSMLRVARPSRFSENIKKNELVNGKRKQKCQSLNVRDIRCPMNISSWSFRVSYLQIKGEEILYLHYITPCDLFWFEYTALSLCQLQTRTCFKMHAGGFWGSANHRNHLMLRLSRFGAIWHYLTLNPSDAFFFSSPKQDDARLIEMRSLMSGPVFKRRLACNNNQSLMQ